MIIVVMPVQTLPIHGNVPKAIAIGLVEAGPFVLSTMLALATGLGWIRVPPRSLLIADCVLRSLTFATLGILAISDQLTLPILIAGLLFGATFRLAGSISRRLLATSIAGDTGRFAVNGLLGLNATFALYIVGPVLGSVIVASTTHRIGRNYRRARVVRWPDPAAAADCGTGRSQARAGVGHTSSLRFVIVVRGENQMNSHISAILLGVKDMERSKRFYTDLGWKVQNDYKVSVFFVPHSGSLVGFYGRDGLAEMVGVSADSSGFSGVVFNYIVRSEGRVDEVLDEAKKAGATILKPAATLQWGGYGGTFADPDGYIWSIGYSAQGRDQSYAE